MLQSSNIAQVDADLKKKKCIYFLLYIKYIYNVIVNR